VIDDVGDEGDHRLSLTARPWTSRSSGMAPNRPR